MIVCLIRSVSSEDASIKIHALSILTVSSAIYANTEDALEPNAMVENTIAVRARDVTATVVSMIHLPNVALLILTVARTRDATWATVDN